MHLFPDEDDLSCSFKSQVLKLKTNNDTNLEDQSWIGLDDQSESLCTPVLSSAFADELRPLYRFEFSIAVVNFLL